MEHTILEANERVRVAAESLNAIVTEVRRVIVGQNALLDRLLIALLADGHLLLEGVPGLAKTLSISTMASIIQAEFSRIQFTPDLLPADILGTSIFDAKRGRFMTKRGPIFGNLVLADEVNRAPAKVQSALLEAMAERQVTIGGETMQLPSPFLVMATMNPLDNEGVYALPEAQLDRFMLKVKVNYPNKSEELEIIERMSVKREIILEKLGTPQLILTARKLIEEIIISDKIKKYIVDLVFATRYPKEAGFEDLTAFIAYGASPRASIYLAQAAKAHAFLRKRSYVLPDDVKAVAPDVLRHRILLTYEAEAEEITVEAIIRRLLTMKVP
ncbi:MAG: AAA family ATPase [Cyanobacteria bacterium NC_groundwater_1444_Ag_S-0.65um_54_12]|nr:AAA family ATPase [Cyanobacteria bacterium NC_groundwater_1444_Ag_S-0.65um_54_12]